MHVYGHDHGFARPADRDASSGRRRRLGACLAAVVTLATVGTPWLATAQSSAPAAAPHAVQVTGDARVDALLSEMTLSEKLTLLEGGSDTSTDPQYQAGFLPGIPRLGIPSLRLTDGPPGVATKRSSVGMTATMGVAATFSQADAFANGTVIGRDARALGQDVVLEPFVNIDRDPTWGRAFNTFGEDPLLTGRTGAAEVKGIQGQGEMAQVKHFVGYDGASKVVIDPVTLHEIYLQPFADAVKAGVASIMCSYNVINGEQSCGNAHDLIDILRTQWGFKGFVTSDWGANHATSYLNAGLTMEMPGGGGPIPGGIPFYFSKSALEAAITKGSIQASTVDRAVGTILYEYDRFGLLTGASKHTVTPEPVQADEKVVLKTGEDAATLLKNDGGVLPLTASELRSLVLIGPGAGQTIATAGGGEKSAGLASRQVGTFQVLQQDEKGNANAHITYAVGDDMTGTPVPASALSHAGTPGLVRTDRKTYQSTVAGQIDDTTAAGSSLPAGSSYQWSGTLTVPATGSYWLDIQSLGATAVLSLDGRHVGCSGCGFGLKPRYGVVHPGDSGVLPTTDGLNNGRSLVKLTAGPHSLEVDEAADVSGNPVQVRLNWVTPAQARSNVAAAVAAAKSASAAVVFAWSTGDLSSPLPDGQDALIEQVAAVNPNTIVVLNNSNPLAMPWLRDVKAVLEMWYPGDEGGYATANVLLGRVDPAGRLPFTWPAKLDQGPANQPTAHPGRTSAGVDAQGNLCTPSGGGPLATPTCTTTYSEGIFVGYRYYDRHHETPLYPFGYGLSYTTFRYAHLATSRASDGGLDVSFDVTNSGRVAGDAVPQVYLGAPQNPPGNVPFVMKALAAYDRVAVPAGKTVRVELHVPLRQLQYWSTTAGWTTATGARTVYVGASERDVRLSTSADIKAIEN